ncbi:MAG: 6-hydroxymethylpterin diphosphokinase MptE-like protein [Halodesulfurarchaeum sp.]
MDVEAWTPIYEAIVADFGFDPEADRRAREYLNERVRRFDLDRLDFDGHAVAIAGGSEGLAGEIEAAAAAERIVAVSSAATVLDDHGVEPDLVVTDLDGTPERAIALSRRGVPVAVHAHGDNLDALGRFLTRFDGQQVIGTTQVEPTDRALNVGGFTDGDRAAYLADHLGAGTLTFPGWDLEDPSVSTIKQRKLDWAARLLRCLERRRKERFGIIDDRRQALDQTLATADWATACRPTE